MPQYGAGYNFTIDPGAGGWSGYDPAFQQWALDPRNAVSSYNPDVGNYGQTQYTLMNPYGAMSAPAPTQAFAPPVPQRPAGPSAIQQSNADLGWASAATSGGSPGNPFASDNPYGAGTAFSNFFESHPGLAGASNFADIRAQAPTIAAGGQFSNPFGQMRSWVPGADYMRPTGGSFTTAGGTKA